MGGIAGGDLAAAVSKQGGMGQIGATADMEDLSTQLNKVEQVLDRHNGLLPVGVGVLSFAMEIDATLPVLVRFKPAVVWIFAANDLFDYAQWAQAVREFLPTTQVWIQVGSVQGALTIAKDTKPDVICLQGVDAGGHGFEKGAGIVSLVPEVSDALQAAGLGDIALVAAGGIADGRAAAAAFTLGAQGIVMGTRFLSATETRVHPQYRAAILAASDGGQSTVRAKVFDKLRGPNQWPVVYDGRSIRTASFHDYASGVDIDEIRRRHAEAIKTDSAGFGADDTKSRAAMWASTAVGLVRNEQRAAEIVEEVRMGILAALEAAKSRL